MKLKVLIVAVLAGTLLWAQFPTPSATINQDSVTGAITAVVSTSKSNRVVCKYIPLPAGAGPYFTLNSNCTLNGTPFQSYFLQFNAPYQTGLNGLTLAINANGNMNVTAIFQPVAAVAPGTTNHIQYQIVANGTLKTGLL